MLIVNKHDDPLIHSCHVISDDQKNQLVRWYTGKGDFSDESASVELVRKVHQRGQWIACDCREDNEPSPILVPALISHTRTYYLRRLIDRREHKIDCPFAKKQVVGASSVAEDRDISRRKRKREFVSVLYPPGDKLANDASPKAKKSSGKSGRRDPALAYQLWSFIEAARINVIEENVGHHRNNVVCELNRLIEGSGNELIAPNRWLKDWIYTHPNAWIKRKMHVDLSIAAPDWPRGHEPQAFLLMVANEIDANRILCRSGEVVQAGGDILTSARKGVRRGPYLVLSVAGRLGNDQSYDLLKTYAQPILDERHFVPVDSNIERTFLQQLIEVQNSIRDSEYKMRIKKPLFDIETRDGPCRPDFIVKLINRKSSRVRNLIFEVMGYETDEYRASKEKTVPRMLDLAPVIEIDAKIVGKNDCTAIIEKSCIQIG